MKTVSVVIVGAGGYGEVITREVLENRDGWGIKIAGIVEPFIDRCPIYETVHALQIPIFPTLEDFYLANRAELAIICSPIYLHEAHCITALQHGSHVLCEKPTAATPGQAQHMEQTAAALGLTLQVGFQFAYLPGILALKQDILAGKLGKPLSASAIVCWPRNRAYFQRPWAGKKTFQGLPVNDSVAMNACAHYLHLPLFLLGDAMSHAAMPDAAEGILCRVNPIETFDTAMLRLHCAKIPIHHFVTHSCEETVSPVVRLEFEKATVEIREDHTPDSILARFFDGAVTEYGAVKPALYTKIPYCCDVVRGLKKPICPVDAAQGHLAAVWAATEQLEPLTGLECTLQNDTLVIPGMSNLFRDAFMQRKMPWALTDRFGKPASFSLK